MSKEKWMELNSNYALCGAETSATIGDVAQDRADRGPNKTLLRRSGFFEILLTLLLAVLSDGSGPSPLVGSLASF